ncbi:hypothetical protein [Rubritalea marina]|uniref:hypothetical protein n=1 Tax=Rubritalea marina TaxID=361055 RepID=UPI000475484D|nr:hypothetical protein [Rubritalea marina]
MSQQTYEGGGFSFEHRLGDKVSLSDGAIPTVRIESPNQSIMVLQNHGSSIEPDMLRQQMLDRLLKQFKGEAEQLQHKFGYRTFFNSPQQGTYILFSKDNVPREALFFSFKHDGDTICIITKMPLNDSRQAERMFATIQNSLTILKN